MSNMRHYRKLGLAVALLSGLGVLTFLIKLRLQRRSEPARPTVDRSEFSREVVLASLPVTVAPGVHMLGGMVPAAVYVIETSEGLVLVDSGMEAEHAKLTSQMPQLRLELGR